MGNGKAIAFITLVSGALAYFGWRKWKEVKALMGLSVSPAKNPFQIVHIDTNSGLVDCNINLLVQNPTAEEIQIANVDLSLFDQNGQRLAITQTNQVTIKANASNTLTLAVQFPLSSLVTLSSLIISQPQVMIDVKGTATYMALGLPVPIPIDFSIDAKEQLLNNLSSL